MAISLALTRFGAKITGFAISWGIIGLAISLAGRDVLTDIISGALILIDRPYRTRGTGSSCPLSIPGET